MTTTNKKKFYCKDNGRNKIISYCNNLKFGNGDLIIYDYGKLFFSSSYNYFNVQKSDIMEFLGSESNYSKYLIL
jgi:hypothetical protein